MTVASVLHRAPLPIRKLAVRALYRRNGKRLEDIVHFPGGFYAYKVDGRYVPSEGLSWYLDFQHYAERLPTMATWDYQPRPGDVVLDIGAGMGEEAIVLAHQVGPTGRVLCIEANPQAYAVLQKVVALNDLAGIVSTHNLAISADEKPITFNFHEATYLSGGLALGGAAGACVVPSLRLDKFLKQHGVSQVSLLKCNIEGAERFVVQTLGDYEGKIERYAISCHDFRFRGEGDPFFATKQMVTEFLTNAGRRVRSQSTGVEHLDDWVYA